MGQDRNAANEGDQLKHSLIAEILGRCLDWPELTYAETHAGAGVYCATNQEREGTDHIRRLHERVLGLEETNLENAGGRYADCLRGWWYGGQNPQFYLGSVLQAALQLRKLKKRGAKIDVRVTEASPEAHKLLAMALKPFEFHPELSGFQHKIGWITQNDHLVLLIDPFTYADSNEGLDSGQIDLETLTALLDKCWEKSGCVVGFWCAMGQKQPEGKRRQERFTQSLRTLAQQHAASFRWFKYGSYSIAWIGIGRGKAVVDGIPDRDQWAESWLSNIVKEAEC